MSASRRPTPDALPRDARAAPQQCVHSVRGHRQLYAAVRAADRQRSGEDAERAVRALRSDRPGEPVLAHQDPGRLLLLRFRIADIAAAACGELRQHGLANDRRDSVRKWRGGGGKFRQLTIMFDIWYGICM